MDNIPIQSNGLPIQTHSDSWEPNQFNQADPPQRDNTHISDSYSLDSKPNGECMDPWNLESIKNIHDSYSQANFQWPHRIKDKREAGRD